MTYILYLLISLFSLCSPSSIQRNSSSPVSHEIWDKVLKKYVSKEGKVNYKELIKDSLELNKYLDLLSQNAPNKNWNEEDQKAYWINAYNVFTVRLIIRNYPVKSIKDIGSKIQIPLINSVWDIKFITIGKESYTLNNIEHDILRKKFFDPRLHFALVCASASCPKLKNTAYSTSKLDEQLDQQAIEFINDETRNKLNPDKIQISEIFKWYKGDFTKNSSLIEFLNKYSKVKINKYAKINHLDYNWSLNEE